MTPVLPILGALAVAGTVAAGVWYWLREDEEDRPPIPPRPEPTPPGPVPPGPTPPTTKTYCSRTKSHYDVDRWSSPATVAAALRKLGYEVSNSLVMVGDVLQILQFQRDARENNAKGYAGVPDAWIDGVVGPCSLIALSDAESRDLWIGGDED